MAAVPCRLEQRKCASDWQIKFHTGLPFCRRPAGRAHAAANLVVFEKGFHYQPCQAVHGQTDAEATYPVQRTSTFVLSHF